MIEEREREATAFGAATVELPDGLVVPKRDWSLLRHWSLLTLAVIFAACLVGPPLLGLNGERIDLEHKLEGPSWSEPFGTDENGRSVLARLLEGGRISLMIGFGAGFLAGAIGCVVGLAAGWFGGWVSALLMRLTDLAISFPSILTQLLLVTLIGHSTMQLLLIIAFTLWTSGARVVRARTLEIRELPYVEGAIAGGASPLRILTRHVLPNMQETVAVVIVLAVEHAVLNEATISFLGHGVSPPQASWGTMLSNAESYFFRGSWLIVFPGLAILLTLLASYSFARRLTSRSQAVANL
jgi:peptide/nickel transport system permease protein